MKMTIASSSHVMLVLCFALEAAATSPHFQLENVGLKDKSSLIQSSAGLMLDKPKVPRGVKGPGGTGDENKQHASDNLVCGATRQVDSGTDKYEDCPVDCPFFAQNRKDTETCTFVCVPAQECKAWNPNKPIPDLVKRSKTCRGPRVDFCTEPALDGTDTCVKCQWGFRLHIEDGQCYFLYWTSLYIFIAIVAVIVTFVTVWAVDLCCRQTINEDEVLRGNEFRARSKNLQPPNAQGHRHVYPIETNLCKDPDVAGPGMLLHFNFQAFLIIWPLVVAIVWTVLACFHNELFTLGTKKFGTPRHNCILVAWGYETQQRLMWTKVLFLVIVYLFSFVSFLLFGVRQLRIYTKLGAAEKTMSDFAAELKGLPPLTGEASTEEDIKKAVASGSGATVVGVSVCWNVTDEQQETILKAAKADQTEREAEIQKKFPNARIASKKPENVEAPAEFGSTRKWMYNKERDLLGPDEDTPEEEPIANLLRGLHSTASAFVVFNTEEEKDKAVQAAQDGKIKFKHGSDEVVLQLEDLECEPGTVNWENFGADSSEMFKGFLKGFFMYYIPALAIWFFIFYVPYAYSLYTFNYDNGAELPGIYSLVFTFVVVGGNATMYVTCDIVCDIIGFRYKDTKQVVYMLFYLSACMINVFLDMIVTYYTALKIMVGLDFRTYSGQRVADIDSFTEQFETYAMQRSLAENTYRYAFPSTFLVPFLIEPIITVLIPYQLGKLIIRTHREIYGGCTEAYIAAFDFDMGRYADILLNVFLGILLFYFPGGYTWSLFYGMFISHIVIYIFDHWRVLNVIPKVTIVSRQVDWWAQVTLGACCAMIMSVLVFKMNCEGYAGYCLKTGGLVTACSVAGVAHFIVHMVLLVYLVPSLVKKEKDANPGMTYEQVAKKEASTWFSVNPVHCLRSKHIHKHTKPQTWLSVGKDHLQQANSKIGCYYEQPPADTEEFRGYTLTDFSDTGKAIVGSWIGSAPKKE